jgi:hypothetical protein
MRTRLRTLHADGRRYTWRAEIRHVTRRREVRLRVWGAGKTRQALQVDLCPMDPEHPLADDLYPDAEDVRALIGEALSQGWQPDTKGGTFTLPTRVSNAQDPRVQRAGPVSSTNALTER